MDKERPKQGTCLEKDLRDIILSEDYDFFVAFQTDRFLSGKSTSEELDRVDVGKLLEVRLFCEKREILACRTMIGKDHEFQWRIASEDGLSTDEYMTGYQTLDINSKYSKQNSNGNLELMTTGGGKYELPISEEQDTIMIISYIDYDADGMAFIFDNRLVKFVKGEVCDHV